MCSIRMQLYSGLQYTAVYIPPQKGNPPAAPFTRSRCPACSRHDPAPPPPPPPPAYASALYAAGGQGATATAVGGAVRAALRRGDYGDGDTAAARARRSFSSAQAVTQGGLDEVEAPWSSLGRPPEDEERWGLGWWADAASRV